MVTIPKHAKIEKLEAKYLLLAHPFPSFQGEMLLTQPKKEDQDDKDWIVYRDYSLRKRLPNRECIVSTGDKIKDKKKKEIE
jgi:hypothetical protein